ncbi:MAG: glycoside hydrolase family 3 protein [Gammaproteobacteria bacterium]|nr:MAG: glycoside hydrolase family 3 protein [Gammaproteobacteria bacterium]
MLKMMGTLHVDGLAFRDLDHDGVLAPFEDWRLSADTRAKDLVGRLSLEEKVGLLLHGTIPAVGGPLGVMGIGAGYDLEGAAELIHGRGVNSMITRLALEPREFAAQNNAVQAIAAEGRFSIPVTVSTDPRHHFNPIIGASVATTGFSQWPGSLGFAATGDPELVRRFGDVVRQEYRATGVHMALSPQADLATSPRWARIDGTFGEDPALVRRLVGAYVEGVQGGRSGLGKGSVVAVVKHWVGYGASEDGFDGHNYYGRFSAFPGGAFEAHVEAFLDALENRVAGVMPTYNILRDLVLAGKPIEQVGAGYSTELLTELLRGQHGYQGLILSDWAIARDVNEACRTGEPRMTPVDISMAWGVEDLPVAERFAKGINAGLDQFGGEDEPGPLLEAVASGLLSEARIDESARRVLVQKFELGLFEDPFVDEDAVEGLVGTSSLVEEGLAAQRRSMVFLECSDGSALAAEDRLYLHDLEAGAFEAAGFEVVGEIEQATRAVVKLKSPSQQLHPGFFFGAFQKEGDLDFKEEDEDYRALVTISAAVPTLLVLEMDRPPILTNVREKVQAMVAGFGVSDEAVVQVLSDPSLAAGRLPYTLPSSMAGVLDQDPDKPSDDPSALYPLGYAVD